MSGNRALFGSPCPLCTVQGQATVTNPVLRLHPSKLRTSYRATFDAILSYGAGYDCSGCKKKDAQNFKKVAGYEVLRRGD